jgi:arginyl-tRNA synthetase
MNLRQVAHQKIVAALFLTNYQPWMQYEQLIINGKSKSVPFYQSNCAMPIAAHEGNVTAIEVANDICSKINMNGLASVKVTGPGFIELRFSATWVAEQLKDLHSIRKKDTNKVVVIDYSGPNLAKEMHVGHLRSTIIGDALARILQYAGHTVIRQNHVGDWGTPFGMLLAHFMDELNEKTDFTLQDLEWFYYQARTRFDIDPKFADRARAIVVQLHNKDPEILQYWKQFKTLSLQHANEVYNKLGVTLNDTHTYGESEYHDMLQPLVTELENNGIASESEGAKVVYMLEKGETTPAAVIIQKADGAFLYSTTDIAAIKYRVETLKAKRILYCIDKRQSLHINRVFEIASVAGYANRHSVSLEHIDFGTMTHKDGRSIMSREGNTIKLNAVLDEAVVRAKALIMSKDHNLTEQEIEEISRKVGIGAVKYSDLCKTRTNDYVFDWDLMLSFNGNTAPYLQYAYTRIHSVIDKCIQQGFDPYSFSAEPILLSNDIELTLATKLLQFNDVLLHVEETSLPHLLCTYLFDITGTFMSFYEACPILKDDVPTEVRNSRIQLALSMSRTLHIGLDLLGIEVMNKM